MSRTLHEPKAYAIFRNDCGKSVRLSDKTYTRSIAMKLAEIERKKTGDKIYVRATHKSD